MIKKTLLFFLLFFLFPLIGGFRVWAIGTPQLAPTDCIDGAWTSCSSAFDDDNIYTQIELDYPNPASTSAEFFDFPSFYLPGNATIDGIQIEIVGYTSNSSAGRQIWVELSKDNGATWQTNSVDNDLMWINPDTSATIHTYYTGTDNVNFNLYNWSYDDFNNGNLRIRLGANDNQLTTFYVDYINVVVRYDIPNSSLHIDSSEASASGQFVLLDLSGTTSTVSALMQCNIGLFEKCTKSGYAGYTSTTPVAHILLDGINKPTETKDLGGGYYIGRGWGGTSSNWWADNVAVPYNPGYECSYPWSIICTDGVGEPLIDDYSTNPTMIATPSAGLTETEYTEPEPTNPLAWVVWKIKQTLIELFIPHDETILQQSQYFQSLLATKAPTAYVTAVLSLDWTTAQQATAPPTIHIELSHTEGGIIPDIHWEAPDFFISAMSTIRSALLVVLWLSFVLYIVVRIRSGLV